MCTHWGAWHFGRKHKGDFNLLVAPRCYWNNTTWNNISSRPSCSCLVMEVWERDCSKGWPKTLGERLVKSSLNKFVPLGRALSCLQTVETWDGCRMLQLVAWAVCSLNRANMGAQHWRRQSRTALASGKVRSGQSRSVLRKLHSKWHLGKVLNLYWVVVFWYSQSPWLGFSHHCLAVGLSKASTLPLHRPAPPRSRSTHPKAATWEGEAEAPLEALIPQLGCLAAITYWYFRWLKFWRGTSLPVWAVHAAYSIPAADFLEKNTFPSSVCKGEITGMNCVLSTKSKPPQGHDIVKQSLCQLWDWRDLGLSDCLNGRCFFCLESWISSFPTYIHHA